MVHNTWQIDPSQVREYIEAMLRTRVVRLKTGGYRWRLFQDVGSPDIFNEVFFVRSWDEHLMQHRRIDDASAEIIGRARRFDVSEYGPVARHSITVSANGDAALPMPRPDDDDHHRLMHDLDGSIPIKSIRSAEQGSATPAAVSTRAGGRLARAWQLVRRT